MKGALQEDRMPTNKYQLKILTQPDFTPTAISGIEEELETVDLPDRTRASGGNTGPIEFTADFPMHHQVEIAALDLWFQEGQDPVSPTYKKGGTLVVQSISGAKTKSYTLVGLFVTKRALPDFEMGNEGDLAVVTYTFSADDMLPV